MAAPQVGPCSAWATVDDIRQVGSIPTGVDLASLDAFADQATALLFELSGRRWPGSCTETVRPTGIAGLSGDRVPYSARETTSTTIGGDCTPSVVTLGAYPVTSVTTVKIDGSTLAASAYRVDEFRFLVRTDGDVWPCCQDLSLDSTEVDTFEVTFVYGTNPDAAGVAACAELALEFARASRDDDACSLPTRLRSIVRQGISVEILDPQEFLERGRLGIYRVDAWLAAVNPHNLRRAAGVVSPDFGPVVAHRVDT